MVRILSATTLVICQVLEICRRLVLQDDFNLIRFNNILWINRLMRKNRSRNWESADGRSCETLTKKFMMSAKFSSGLMHRVLDKNTGSAYFLTQRMHQNAGFCI